MIHSDGVALSDRELSNWMIRNPADENALFGR
jgi:hypothetical protein